MNALVDGAMKTDSPVPGVVLGPFGPSLLIPKSAMISTTPAAVLRHGAR